MRFKLQKDLIFMGLATFCVLLIALEDKLLVYIHPRYVAFTITLSLVSAVLLIASVVFKKSKTENHKDSLLSLLPISFIIFIMLVLPPQTLSSSTVTQRLTTTQSGQQSAPDFTGSTSGLSVSDWFQLLNLYQEPEYYSLKPADLTGFVYDAGLGEDTFWVSRFVLTCCAVDARPVGVPVHLENWKNEYSENDWVNVKGQFELTETAQGSQIVLIPESIQPTAEPEDPYELW